MQEWRQSLLAEMPATRETQPSDVAQMESYERFRLMYHTTPATAISNTSTTPTATAETMMMCVVVHQLSLLGGASTSVAVHWTLYT